MPNPNENCLEGKRCPKCGSYGPFQVTATSVFTIADDGTDDYGDVEYDEKSPASCRDCQHFGTWADFDDPETKEAKPDAQPEGQGT